MRSSSYSKHARERWIITVEQVQNLRTSAHRLLERLTIVSGYGELALEGGSHPEVQEKLVRIVGAARVAKHEILSAVAVLDALTPCPDCD